MEKLTEGILWYLVFIFSTTFHEAAHAFTAMRMGDRTAHKGGQVTLNPIPHIKREPFGTIIMPVLSFAAGGWMIGWASTPYDRKWAYDNPRKAAAMAAAGPMSNFILILLSAALIHIGIYFGYLYAPQSITISSIVAGSSEGIFAALAKILSVMFSLNLILFIFNLIPFPPLDGSGIIPLYLSKEAGQKYMRFVSRSAFSIIGLLIAWKLFDMFYFKIHLIFINLLYPGVNYH